MQRRSDPWALALVCLASASIADLGCCAAFSAGRLVSCPRPAALRSLKAQRHIATSNDHRNSHTFLGLLVLGTVTMGAGSGRGRSRKALHSTVLKVLPATIQPESPENVVVCPDADAVALALCEQVKQSASQAIAERGAFALAIPGGSILKMLASGSSVLSAVDWSKCVMAYVNHKCVPNNDAAATHKKATDLFLGDWQGIKVITVGGSGDGAPEAARYESELQMLPSDTLPKNEDGFPVFDLVLIGVGDDGHFGSLYPGRPEIIDESQKWVLPVDMKSPPSITLSRSAMVSARRVVVASAGVSEKYPQGKSDAMQTAIEGTEGPTAFPAQALRGRATWLLDAAAASKLSAQYLE